MKKIILIMMSFAFINKTTAQEIKVASLYSHSSYDKYRNDFGYIIGYNQFVGSRNRLGLTFLQSFNNIDYEYTFSSDADGNDYYREVKPKNERITFSIDYSFSILKKQKSNLYIGPKIGINYLHIREYGNEKLVYKNETYEYKTDYWVTNKMGIGLLLEYERELFSENISQFFSTETEIIFISKYGLMGSSDPVLTGWINLNLGLKYRLNKNVKIKDINVN
jgi:hypothetical protein